MQITNAQDSNFEETIQECEELKKMERMDLYNWLEKILKLVNSWCLQVST